MRKARGGFVPTMGALAAVAGRSALGWLVPKVMNWVTKKAGKKSKGKKGKGVQLLGGQKGKGVQLLGGQKGKGVQLLGGHGLYLHGKKGNGIKQIASKIKNSAVVKGLVARAKKEAVRHAKYAVDNPQTAYNNVKKIVTGKGVKKMKSLTVKQRKIPKQKVAIASNQAGGTTAITISKRFGTNKSIAQPMSLKRIRSNNVM